jgi:hypothetical protein
LNERAGILSKQGVDGWFNRMVVGADH